VKNHRVLEFVVGCFMLLGLLALLFLALKVSGLSNFWHDNSYQVNATFTNIGDLKARAPVTVAGVKVGYVKAIKLEPSNFRADVVMAINNNFHDLPVDSSASIYTQGLLGSNYISLTPGFESQTLRDGSRIQTTHSALILENLIGQFMYKIGGKS